MRFSTSPSIRLIAALCAAAALALPSLAGAQQYPSYATAAQQTIKGTITGLNGTYTVYVQDEKGYGDNVQMHDGTVINPTGIKLQAGMRVTIYGYANGPAFNAYRIDVTPADYGYGGNGGDGGYGGYGNGYGYGGYPYGGYGYGYPWGVGIGWWGGWGWPGYYGGYPYYGYPYYPYYPGPGPGRDRDFRHGTVNGSGQGAPGRGGMGPPPRSGSISAPPRGSVGAPPRGSMGGPPRGGSVSAPPHGSVHGGRP